MSVFAGEKKFLMPEEVKGRADAALTADAELTADSESTADSKFIVGFKVRRDPNTWPGRKKSA